MRATVLSSMRNEGPFIVEWLAWYRMLGFDRQVIITNNCTDHSVELLEALSAAGGVATANRDFAQGKTVTRSKLNFARTLRPVRTADWLFICDADEFLVIHRGEGRLTDLVGADDPPWLAMAINWRVFGSDEITEFSDQPVHQQFFGALAARRSSSCFFKTLLRKPAEWAKMGEHAPLAPGPSLAQGRSPARGEMLVNASGQPVTFWDGSGEQLLTLPTELVSYEWAQINHYMLRSAETFSLKAGTKSPAAQKDRYTESYRMNANSANELDIAALKYAEAFEAERERLMALPDVARLHALCCADHLRAIAAKAGRDPAKDPRIAMFLNLSEE